MTNIQFRIKVMFLKLINLIAAASAVSLFTTGCASVISGNAQSIYVTTECRGRSMPAACTATNDQGSWRFNTPANMLIKKSSEDLLISCKSGLFGDFSYKVTSSPGIPMLGNLLIGGGIGAVIDVGNSAGFEYPESISLEAPICKKNRV